MLSAKRKRLLSWFWFFGCLAALMAFLQWRLDYVLNSDMASEMVLTNYLAQHNAILTPNWYYATELHVWFSQLIFSPLFKVLTDWHVIRVAGSAVLYALVLLGYLALSRRLGLMGWYLWTAPILLLPVSVLYFQFAVYATPYTFYIANVFFLLAMILGWRQCKGRAGRALLACGVGALSLLTGLNGPRYLMVFFLPLILAAAAELLMERGTLVQNGKLCLKGNAAYSFLKITLFAGFFAAAGYLINSRVLAGLYSFAQFESIRFDTLTFAKLEALINGWLDTFGYNRAGALLSPHAVQNLIGVGLTVLSGLAVRDTVRRAGSYTAEERTVSWLFLAAALLFSVLYLTTDATYNERYDLPIAVFALPAITLYLKRAPWRPRKKTFVCAALIVAVGFNAALSYHTLWQQDTTGELRAVSSLLTERGYREGYSSFWNANVMTELTDGAVDVRVWGANSVTELTDVDRVYPWLQLKEHENTVPEGKVFILFNSRERDAFSIVQNLNADAILYQTDNFVLYGYDSYAALKSDAAG
jgi:hypothetical protein